MRSYQQFFAELKRRHVFKVVTIYGVVAFGVLQVAEPLGTALGLSDSFLSLIVGLLLLGFPVALVLAWAFEVTPDGMQKTSDAAPGEIEAILSLPALKRWPAGLLALAGIALLFGGWWMGRRSSPDVEEVAEANLISGLPLVDLSDDPRPSIAVLPFLDMSSTQDQEYFGDGMTEAILNVLTRAGDMRVSGRTSAFAFKGENKDLREIGAELGVTYLVEGSVAREGDQVRITAQLITAEDGSHLWSDQYTRPLTSIFDIQSEISAEITDALKVSLGIGEGAVTPTADFEAYDLYLAGRSRLRKRQQGTFDAIDLFEAALARDSGWAPAWAGLADALEISTWQDSVAYDSIVTYGKLAQAERAARQALELQPGNPTALVALGSIHRDRHQWAEAEGFYREALDLDPDNAEAHQQYGEWLAKRGRIAEAVRSVDRATALDPAPIRVFMLAYFLRMDGRWDEAEDVYRWAVAQGLDQQYFILRIWTERVGISRAFEEGRYEDWLAQGMALNPDWTARDTVGGAAVFQAYRAGRWELVPDSLRDEDLWEPEELVLLNRLDEAADKFVDTQLTRRPHDAESVWWVMLDPIRSRPRFQAYVESIGLDGLTPRRTPVDQRIRPAILRRAEAAATATGSTATSAP